MYFTVKGEVSPCWLTVGSVDKWSEDRSIMDIWKGGHFGTFDTSTHPKCMICKENRDNGVWNLASVYDEFPVREYPTLIELELSNQCNLECIMCSGLLSSGIRKNRDKLPPLPMAYTPKFVEELEEFVPHLEELRINGGEPFAQKIVLDICDMVARVNPTLKVVIATNGTIINKRVGHIMDHVNLHLNISIDSLDFDRYPKIRINGKLDEVLHNFEIFRDYCKRNNRTLCVMVNPMANNWDEMAQFVRWTNEKDVDLHYNTVVYPKYLALRERTPEFLEKVVQGLEDMAPPEGRNTYKYHSLVKQVKNWHLDSLLSVEDSVE